MQALCAGTRLALFSIVAIGLGGAAMLATDVAAQTPATKPPVVAAASDLKFALDQVAAAFTTQSESAEKVDIVFGASGNLTRQLLDGAPFELFLSADEDFVFKLADAGLTRDRGSLYAIGRVVVFAPRGSPLTVDERLDGLRTLVAKGGALRFAIANPAYAPYGRAAEAVLRTKGLWTPLQPSIVLGENIAQAAQFAASGNTVGGILSYSLVLAPPLRDQGTYALIPESDHPPLRQRMVLMKKAGATAQHFYEYLQTPAARDLLRRHGFTLPAPAADQPAQAQPK